MASPVPFETDFRTSFTLDDYVGDVASDKTTFDAIINRLTDMNAPDALVQMLNNDRNFTIREAIDLLDQSNGWEQVIADVLVRLGG